MFQNVLKAEIGFTPQVVGYLNFFVISFANVVVTDAILKFMSYFHVFNLFWILWTIDRNVTSQDLHIFPKQHFANDVDILLLLS